MMISVDMGVVAALIALAVGAIGAVVGSKVSLALLRRAHERFEQDVWTSLGEERNKRERIDRRVATLEGRCNSIHGRLNRVEGNES